jgi:hypothetical protein
MGWSAQAQVAIDGPVVSEPVVPHEFTGDVRDLPKVPLDALEGIEVNPRGGEPIEPRPAIPTPDPLLQEQREAAVTRALDQLSDPILNFDAERTGSNPHDPVGDVGPHHYVEMINSIFAIYDIQRLLDGDLNARVAGPSPINSLWTDVGISGTPCSDNNQGDPIVLYDRLVDRWLLSQFADPNHLCMAVSQTPDPTGGYYLYDFDVNDFPDYFKLGVWPDGYYMSSNIGGGDTHAAVFERLSMLNGAPARQAVFNISGLPGLGFNVMLPSDLDGATPPPPGSPNFFYRQADGDVFGGNDRVEIFEFSVNWADPQNLSTFAGPTNINLAGFDSDLCGFLSFRCVPQPDNATRCPDCTRGRGATCIGGSLDGQTCEMLDPINEVPMWRLQYRNFGTHETLVGNFTVDADGNDGHGIRWFELRKSPGAGWALHQEGTFAPQPPDATSFVHRWMGSVAMDQVGNIALGYSVSNETDIFPSIRYTGRRAVDGLNFMTQGERTIIAGGSQIRNFRWGDYTSLNVDPADDCTFWYINDYVTNAGRRQPRIAAFQFDDCFVPVIQVPGSVDFADTCVGEAEFATLEVCNTGHQDLEVDPITSSDPQFAVTVPSSDYPVVISPDFCFPFEVTFTPAGPGPASARLTIPSNDRAKSSVEVTVSGTGGEADFNLAIANAGEFGGVCLGEHADLDLTLFNQGACNLTIDSITSSDAQFVLPTATLFPLVLSPDAQFILPVRFEPTDLGAQNATITIDSDDPDTPVEVVDVSGDVSPGDIRVTGNTDFGDVCAEDPAEETVSVCNVGPCNLEVTSASVDCPDFTLINNSFPAAVSSDFCIDLVVAFTPTSAGPKSCTLTINSDDPDTPVTTLDLTANTPFGSIDVPPDQGFRPTVVQSVDVCESAQPFPVSNTGRCNLDITNLSITANAAEYSLSGRPSLPIILEPGHVAGSGDLNTVFAPNIIDRDREGTVSVTYVQDPITGATATEDRALCGEGVFTGARVLVTHNGTPLPEVKSIRLHRINANRNKNRLDTVDNARRVPLQTVAPNAPCAPFVYHREYGTVANPVQLLPGSYEVTVQTRIDGRMTKRTVGFDVNSCGFNPTIVVNF